MRVWFITGASRGIGQAIAKAALAAGDRVVAASRTGEIGVEDFERLLSLKLDISNPDMAAYAPCPVINHSSKFAVTGFSVALAFEVAPFGIKVTNVAPGMFRTSFYDKGTWGTEPDRHISDYDANRWQPSLVAECQKHQQPGDPDKLATLILEVADAENPPLHLAIGTDGPQVLDAYIAQVKADTDTWCEKAELTSYES